MTRSIARSRAVGQRLIARFTQVMSDRFGSRDNLVRIIANTGWLFGDRVLRLAIGLGVVIWLARYLGPDAFGLINYAMAFVALFAAIANLGLHEVVVRQVVRSPKDSGEILGTAFVMQLVAGALAGTVIVAVTLLIHDDAQTRMLVAILAPLLTLRAGAIVKAWFESRLESKYVVLVEQVAFLTMAASQVILILAQAPLYAFVLVLVVEALLASLGLLLVHAWKSAGLNAWRVRVTRAGWLLKQSWPLILSSLAIMVYMRIDQVMLGQMVGNQAVGVYSAAVRISEVWYFIPLAIIASIYPALVEGRQQGEDAYRQRLQTICDLMVLIALLIAIPMTFFSTWAVVLLFGSDYRDAGVVLAIHVWASLFVFLGLAIHKGFMAENLQKLTLYRTLFGAVINVVLNFFLIPRYGAQGAAIATVAAQGLPGLLLDFWDRRTRHFWLIAIKALFVVRLLAPGVRSDKTL